MTTPTDIKFKNRLAQDITFIGAAMFLAMGFLTLLRLLLFLRNIDFAENIPTTDILFSFLIGLRFDLIVVCIGSLPLLFILFTRNDYGQRRIATIWLSAYIALCLFMGIVELEFYQEFQTRLNNLAAQYLREDPATVMSMLWHGFPLVKYFLLWLFLVASFFMLLRTISNKTSTANTNPGSLPLRLVSLLLVFVLIVMGGRGTLRSGPPLRWGDAFHSQHLFANHLPLNAAYTFVNALRARDHQQNAKRWLGMMGSNQATLITRKLLKTPTDKPIWTDDYPIERIQPASSGSHPKNVVLILMESFSAEFVGALGKPEGITPYFDALTDKGILFERFFSNGTHTHQGMFATVACFPNLPGYEYLMQEPQGQHQFSGLPVVLGKAFNDVYVYNGEFSWDNQQGFFRNQGVTRFFGRGDYIDPIFIDPTWGVSDEDMFNQSLIELQKLGEQDKPFYAILQTLSNHVPYALPEKLPFEPVTGYGRLDEHLTAQKYSDWALGQFFKEIEKTDYYDDTLFVIVGDHGFGLNEQLSSINLLTFHVPLLVISKNIRNQYAPIQSVVGTQVDIVPTIGGLLGLRFAHQCWGRNLLALPSDDEGFGMIKPSGGSQTVAFIEGDKILVKVAGAGLELGEFELGTSNHFTRLNNDGMTEDMSQKLNAFIQTALRALQENKTGVSNQSAQD